MTFMKSLTLIAAPRVNRDPVRNRRERLIARLQEQKELISNPSLVRTVQRTVKKDGVRTVNETQQKVRPWWRTDEKGQVILFVRIGWMPRRKTYRSLPATRPGAQLEIFLSEWVMQRTRATPTSRFDQAAGQAHGTRAV